MGPNLWAKKLKKMLDEMNIEFYNSTPSYPQCNGQAEESNKTIVNGIKKRLEKAMGKWVKELLNMLWAYRTTSRRAMNETLYSLVSEFEPIILLEVKLPTIRTQTYDEDHNSEMLGQDLDLANEKREMH